MTGDRDRAPWRAVVADDDADIRLLVGIAVRRAGLELAADAADGDAAWLAILREKPQLVVLDVSMPGLTGLQLCRLIRADDRLSGIRILLLSASVDDASRRTATSAGADEFLVKPFSPRELAARLAEISTGERVHQ